MNGIIEKYLWWLPFGEVPEIDADELRQKLTRSDNQVQLLDVRSPPEWQGGIIDGSVMVPLHHLKGQIENLGFDKSKSVVAICRSAHRSVGAVRLLRSAGFNDVSQLQGGMLAWQGNNFQVVNPES